jgi:hypothetical protein
MTDEIWKAIPGYEGYYEVSTYGNVRGLDRTCAGSASGARRSLAGQIIVPSSSGRYRQVKICKDGDRKSYLVHRLVALAFLENPDNLPTVDHIDRKKYNNHISNLRWASRSTQQRNTGINCLNTSGEKNIHFDTQTAKYRVKISYLKIQKRFESMAEAIKYRDEILAANCAV